MGSFSIWHWLVAFPVLIFLQIPAYWVIKRSGQSRLQFVLTFIPLINLVWLWIFAFGQWPSLKDNKKASI